MLNSIVPEWGDWFLDEGEIQEFRHFDSSQGKVRDEWLRGKVMPKMHPLWYFVVSLFRLLQQGEYWLSPTDAYWLGIVDEVIGAELPCPRLILESQFSATTEPKQT